MFLPSLSGLSGFASLKPNSSLVFKNAKKRSGKFNDLFGNLATKTYVSGLSCQAWEEKLSFGIMLII